MDVKRDDGTIFEKVQYWFEIIGDELRKLKY